MGCCLGGQTNTPPTKIMQKLNHDYHPSLLNVVIKSEAFIKQIEGNVESYYLLDRLLGTGAYGQVYEAVHKLSGSRRAIKRISREKVPSSQADQMLAEVQVLKSLDNPHIIRIIEVIVEPNFINIVTELCTGGELFDKIYTMQKFSEEMASTYIAQVLSAMAYCHDHNIVHRDLKPENLLLESSSPDALLKVIDFGTSSKIDPDETLNSVLGTVNPKQPFYIAPEVLSKNYTQKCDVWSCGVILFILLCGSPPFTGRSDREILNKVKKGIFDFARPEWEKISSNAKDIVKRMMTFDPQQRPTARELLKHKWLQKGEKINANKETELDIMIQLHNFRTRDKLKHATLQYIASQLTSLESTEQLRRKFIEMDLDHDGKLSREELVKGYKILGLSSDVDVDMIMQTCDTDHSGFIDYSEFVTAAMDWQSSLNDKVIEAAFKAFDTDNTGKIELHELKELFGSQDDTDEAWRDVIAEVDQDGDGCIDFKEFKDMMLSNQDLIRQLTH